MMVQKSFLNTQKKWLSYADNGREIVKQRKERIKQLDDDLPKVAAKYIQFKEKNK